MLGYCLSHAIKNLISKVEIMKTNDDSKIPLRLNQQQYLPEEVFCSVFLYLLIKRIRLCFILTQMGVCGGTGFICELGQKVGKAS